MKTLHPIFITVIFICLTSFKSKNEPQSSFIKDISPNFSKVQDNLYFSKYETSNKEYRNFLAFLKQTNQTALYKQSLMDTSKWANENSTNRPFVVYYHTHPSYDRYPVVTVTYDNAIAYCKWLTQQYNADPSRKFKKVLFRLPTENEWVYATKAGNEDRVYAWDGKMLRNKKGIYLANIKRISEANISYDQETKMYKVVLNEKEQRTALLAETKSFYPNEFGLYNMIGNAAEMVAEKGMAKGGSFNDAGYDVRVDKQKKYTSASPEIGFRVVMDIQQY